MAAASEVTILSSVLTGFRELVRSRGVDYDDVLAEVGLYDHDVDDPELRLPFQAVARVMELAAERAGDPCLGIAFAEVYPRGGAGVLGYLVVHATTVREALQVVQSFASLLLHPITVELSEEVDSLALSWRFPEHLTAPHTQLASFMMTTLVSRLRQMSGGDWYPQSVEIEHRGPPCTAAVNRILGPRTVFNSRRYRVTFDSRTLARRLDEADPRLFSILRSAGEAKLSELTSRPDIVMRTTRAIAESLNSEPPLLEHIARRLRISPRALQNRLGQKSTTFERVLSETRRALAVRYLRDTDLSLTEIAFLLGFSEQSAFTRAARGWFGCPPRAMRDKSRRGMLATNIQRS